MRAPPSTAPTRSRVRTPKPSPNSRPARGAPSSASRSLPTTRATATSPTVDTNLWSDLSGQEIATGNGYTANGISVARNTTDWDVLTEDDANDRAFVQLKNLVWTAGGGPIPSSGAGARYAVLMDDNATPANRDVLAVFDLGSDRAISDGQTLSLIDCERRDT